MVRTMNPFWLQVQSPCTGVAGQPTEVVASDRPQTTSFYKQAVKPYAAGISPEAASQNNSLKAEALKRVLKTGLIGLGVGAGSAALLGLPHLRKKEPYYPSVTEVDLPYPQVKEKRGLDFNFNPLEAAATKPLLFGGIGALEGSRKAADPTEGALYGGFKGLMHGVAAAPGVVLGGHLGQRFLGHGHRGFKRHVPGLLGATVGGLASERALNPFVEKAVHKTVGDAPAPKAEKEAGFGEAAVKALGLGTPAGAPSPTVGSPAWLRGDSHTEAGAIPWAMPAAVSAGLGGLVGGHTLVQHLLRKRHKAQLDKELEDAQKEYESAMLSQYDPTKLRKLSSKEASAPASALDFCYDALEKGGFAGLPSANNLAGHAVGGYATAAALLGLGSGLGTYRWLKGRGGDKLMRDALKRRALIRSLQNPPEVHVRPVGVEHEHHGHHGHHKKDGEHESA